MSILLALLTPDLYLIGRNLAIMSILKCSSTSINDIFEFEAWFCHKSWFSAKKAPTTRIFCHFLALLTSYLSLMSRNLVTISILRCLTTFISGILALEAILGSLVMVLYQKCVSLPEFGSFLATLTVFSTKKIQNLVTMSCVTWPTTYINDILPLKAII